MQRKAVFLDRDGVINETVVINGKPYPPGTLDEMRVSADVLPALISLKKAGFLLIGATNQPDVARGKTEREVVESINQYLLAKLPLDEIYVCYHDDVDQCLCRKPGPGLLLKAAKQHGIDLSKSFMVGDRWKDIAAGKRAGCRTIWLDYHYQEPFLTAAPDFTTATLMGAASWIVNC